jgi:hypothetical protein
MDLEGVRLQDYVKPAVNKIIAAGNDEGARSRYHRDR